MTQNKRDKKFPRWFHYTSSTDFIYALSLQDFIGLVFGLIETDGSVTVSIPCRSRDAGLGFRRSLFEWQVNSVQRPSLVARRGREGLGFGLSGDFISSKSHQSEPRLTMGGVRTGASFVGARTSKPTVFVLRLKNAQCFHLGNACKKTGPGCREHLRPEVPFIQRYMYRDGFETTKKMRRRGVKWQVFLACRKQIRGVCPALYYNT